MKNRTNHAIMAACCCLFIFFSGTDIFGEEITIQRNGPGVVEAAAVSVSSSTAQNAPGYFLIDGDSSTGWGPGGGAGECRAQLELATASLVVGAELSGSFGPGDRLVLEYLDGGGWVPFAGGFLEGAELDRAAAGAFYDLSLEGAVTDTVRIRLLSPGGAMITEAAVIGIDAGEVPHTLRPVLIEETDNISPFYPAWHLLDGNTRTAFRTISPPFFEEVLETILSLSDERTGIPRHTVPAPGESAEITMRFAPGTAVSVIRLYFRDGARGNTIVETGLQGVFTQAAVISEGSTAGWTAVSLATGPENAVVMDAIRITVEGSGFGLGGISEAEVWGYGDYRGAERRTIAGTEQRLLDGDVNAVFYVDNVTVRDRTAIEVLCRGGVDMPMEINLNGKVYSRMPDMETGGNTLYRFEADGDDFVRGKNCLRIGAIDDGTGEAAEVLCARVAVERRDGEIAPFAVQRSLAAAFGAGEADIGTGETMLLHEAEVRHTEGVFTDIFAEADQTWTGLEPTGEGPYHHRFAPAGGEPITTRRLRVMKDPAGRTAGMRVLGSPVTDGPPEVRFVNPADGDEIASGDVPFVICYTDDPGAVVFINGFPAFKRGNYHWTPLMWLDDWEDGSLTIEAAATGAGGMTAETAITVYRAPGVLFSTDLPDETIHTVSDSIEVTGSVLNTLIDITVNGIQAAVSQKRFSVTVNLDEGLNTITIYGKHRTSGMEGVIRRQVVRYGGGLVLDVEYPEDGWHTRAGEVIVSGTATGAGETVVSVNGVPAIVEGSRFYSEPAALSEGENTIAVTAEDGAGRQATGTLTVYRDTIPPDITGITPGDGALVASSVVTFEITLEETGPVWVTVNGQPCIKEGNIHTAELVFPDGCRQVRITAGDAAGNVSEGLVTLTTDTTPPVEFGVTAEPAGWTNDNRPVLTFETEDEVSGISGYSVSVDGGGFEAAESPYMLPPLTDGEHLVTVTATDHAGWERYAFTSVYIDTTPPEEISGFKVIPGNGKAIVEWEGGEEDVDRYELERIPEPDGGIVILEAPGYTDGGLINGETYSYRVRAIDRAENAGEYTGWTAIESGIEREPYDPEGTTVAEFDGVTIYLPAQDGDEGIACIEIYEEQAEGIPETAVNPIVSPMYEIHPVDSNGRKILEGNGIANDYVAAIRYDELMIPEGKREDELGVYYFDAVWGRWFIIDNYVVDRENNRIYFSSDHFSLYTVQATVSQDLGTEEYAEAGYSPFRTYAVHGSLAVSQKGGSVHNNVTELVLPGPAGFDLAISRRYDTSTGVSDSRITADIDTSGNNVDLTPYLKNQGDVTYSMGNGWRLELPYIKNAGSCEILVLPGGSMHSFFDMKIEEEDSDDEEVSVLSLTPRDKEEFKLKVTREKVTYFKNSHYYEEYETWKNNGYVLSMKDGTSYTLDDTGRCTKIADPTGLNTITVTYKSGEGVYKIDYIEDALGRKVRFEYTTIHDLPYIKNISVDGDPYERTVTYTQDQNGMLTEANDAGGRIWRYDYAEILINASPGPAPFSLTDALNKLGDSERRETSKEINEALESYNDGQEIFHHARLLSGLRGPGKGIITVIYGINTIDDRLFPQANEIVIYPDGERSELNLPQRRTIYEYMMDEEAVPDGDGEVNPDRTKRYLKETRERDGSRETVYTYEPYITEKNRWKLGEEGEIEEAKKKGYDVATRISSIARTEPAGGNVLERTVFTYPEERQTARPAGKTVYHGDGNYIRTTYDYDEYGNVVKAEEYGTTGGRENRLVKKMIYRGGLSSMQPSGGETEPPNYDDAWKPYGEPGGNDDDGFSVPDMTMYKNDILLAVLTLNYVPAFDDNGNLDEDGETVSYQYAYYEYDEKGQVKRNAVWDSGNETWRISAFTYDYETAGGNEYGNVVSQTDPREHVTTFSYDANGYMTKRTEKDVCNADALDGDATNDTYTDITTAYGYEAASGWLRWTRNPRGYVTEYEYDKLGRTTAIVEPDDDDAADYTPLNGRPDNPETVLSYGDTAGDLYAEVVDPEGSKTRYGFDDYGQLTGVIKYTRDEGGVYGEYSTTHLTYNRWGDIATITDPNGNTTAFGYDPMGRRNLIVYPDGNTNRNDNPAKHLDFDYSDNILTVTDENGKISSILNDMKGRVLETTQHNGGETITTETYYDGAGNTIAVKGPKDGFFVMNEYDSRNRLAHTIMPEEEFYENGESVSVKPEIWYAYDETGNKVSEAYGAPDGEWRITCYAYDEAGRTIQATQMNLDGEGEETILARRRSYYDANGNITREVDANNVREALGEGETPASVSYTYTAQDKLKTQTDREGNTTSYTYDKDGSVRTLTGPRGNSGNYDAEDFTLTYEYDDLKRLVRAELPPKGTGQQDVEIGFAYDKRGNLLSRTEPDGGKTIYTYTARNQVETETLEGSGTEYTTAYTYDRAGNLKTITDPRGKTTEHDYDDLNRVVKTTFPLGNDVRYEYDEDNNRTAETDGEGNRTDYTYDLYKRMRQVKTPGADNPAVTGYDRLGNITGTTNTLGHTRTYAYDNRSRLTTETDELGNDYTFTYDNEGNILTTTDPNGTYSEYSYTNNYKIKTITMANTALGKTKTINYRYDEAGAIIWTNDDGVTTSCNGYDPDDQDAYTPDPYDRILEQTTKVGNRIFTTNYNYDIMDRITGLTYPNDNTVTYSYNNLGEITGMPGYLDGAPTYEDGLLKVYTASNNNTTTFDYDDNGRLSNLSNTNTGTDIKSYTFTYDNADNIIQRNSDHFDYDEENRLTNAYLNGSFQADVEDETQKTGVIREDMKGGKQLEFNLEFVLDDPSIIELDYAAGSIGVDLEGLYEVTRIELKAENPNNRVIPEAIRVFASETALENYEEITDFTVRYEEKDGETILAIKLLPPVTVRLIKVKTNFDDRNADFSWRDKAEFKNGVDEIIRVYYNVEQRDEAYEYDDLGNRTEETITLDGTKTKTTRYYPNCSRLMTNGKYVYTYDANGNITGKGTHVAIEGSTVKVSEVDEAYWEGVSSSIDGITIAEEGQWWEYEYDLLNRMVEVSKNGETKATYTYNEAGLMVKKEGSKGTIYSTYSQNGKLLYEEYADADTYRQYVYAFGRQFAREDGTIEEIETVPVYTATDRIYYSTDHLGSVVAVTNESGSVLWKNDYTPFGELADPENTFDGAQVYAGHFRDEDAELYYAKARWYDAGTGRFTTVDPIKDGVNWYVYCNNSPLVFIDETGLYTDYSEYTWGYDPSKGKSSESSDHKSEGLADLVLKNFKEVQKKHPEMFEGLDEKSDALITDALITIINLYLWADETGKNWNWGEFGKGFVDQAIENAVSILNQANRIQQYGQPGALVLAAIEGAWTGYQIGKELGNQINEKGIENVIDSAALAVVNFIKDNPEEVSGRTVSQIVQIILVTKGVAKLESISQGMSAVNDAAGAGVNFPKTEAQLSHIFRDAEGHVADTIANRQLIQNCANDVKNFVGVDKFGNNWFAKTLENGQQVWAKVRSGIIDNAGINTTPRTFDF